VRIDSIVINRSSSDVHFREWCRMATFLQYITKRSFERNQTDAKK